MKLWRLEWADYFGNDYYPVYYTSRAAAEEHANEHPHYAKVSYAGNYSERRAQRFLTIEEATALSPADFFRYREAEIKYLESYAEYPAYRSRFIDEYVL